MPTCIVYVLRMQRHWSRSNRQHVDVHAVQNPKIEKCHSCIRIYSTIFHPLLSTFSFHMVHLYQFHYIYNLYDIKTYFICSNLYLMNISHVKKYFWAFSYFPTFINFKKLFLPYLIFYFTFKKLKFIKLLNSRQLYWFVNFWHQFYNFLNIFY